MVSIDGTEVNCCDNPDLATTNRVIDVWYEENSSGEPPDAFCFNCNQWVWKNPGE